jgi:hypothetical protein
VVSELGKLDLEHALLGMGVLGEDIEDQGNAVHDVTLKRLLEVALLGGTQVVVEYDDVDVLDLRNGDKFLELPASDEGRSRWAFTTYQHRFHRLRACSLREKRELIEACLTASQLTFGADQADE